MRIKLPPCLHEEKIGNNSIVTQIINEQLTEVNFLAIVGKNAVFRDATTWEKILVIRKGSATREIDNYEKVISASGEVADWQSADFSELKLSWKKHPLLDQSFLLTEDYAERVRESWKTGHDLFKKEGLRKPQIWALCGIISHDTTSEAAGTIIMPTWTWKTEVMLTAMISLARKNILVIVPTDALRSQTSNKFIKLWILRNLGLVGNSCMSPVVSTLRHNPKAREELDEILEKSNVVITTMSVLARMEKGTQEHLAKSVWYLFVDEAHHIWANTWHKFREHFKSKRILQFTATPFRNDRKIIDWKTLYNYPLHLAQEEGYFKQINFIPVTKVNPEEGNAEISRIAIEKLKGDLENWKKHLLMARWESIQEAEKIYDLYYAGHSDLQPVLVHSELSPSVRQERLNKLKNLESKVVVCVDMLWEGYDLPNLKIAAFHHAPKSLWITLQLIWRFTRAEGNDTGEIGNATVIANVLGKGFSDEVKSLYSEDSDWNRVVPSLSSWAITKQLKFLDFVKGFEQEEELEWFPLQNIQLPFSSIFLNVLEVNWNDEAVVKCAEKNFKEGNVWFSHNPKEKTAIFIERITNFPDFWRFSELMELEYVIHVITYDEGMGMMYVLSDSVWRGRSLVRSFTHKESPVNGEIVYRSFQGLNRLQLFTVGLRDTLSKNRSYSMHAGFDVTNALTGADQINKVKVNIFWFGYERWKANSVWASAKGKIWSKFRGNLFEWKEWAKDAAVKIKDPSADLKGILEKTLKPKKIGVRPALFPIMADWGDGLYQKYDSAFLGIDWDGGIWLENVSISLKDPSDNGGLLFSVRSDGGFNAIYEIELSEQNGNKWFEVHKVEWDDILLRVGKKKISLLDEFNEDPPTFTFANGSMLKGNAFIEIDYSANTLDMSIVKALDWTGVNIQEESQGIPPDTKKTNSIQHKVIQDLLSKTKTGVQGHAVLKYDLIFNDDGSGEIADIVAVSVDETRQEIAFELYHCKWSGEQTPWSRIKDLYEVCGQAQKSVRRSNISQTLDQIRARGADRPWRFERWDDATLLSIERACEHFSHNTKMYIVQPWVSKGVISVAQKSLLGVTATYLKQTFEIPLEIWVSE